MKIIIALTAILLNFPAISMTQQTQPIHELQCIEAMMTCGDPQKLVTWRKEAERLCSGVTRGESKCMAEWDPCELYPGVEVRCKNMPEVIWNCLRNHLNEDSEIAEEAQIKCFEKIPAKYWDCIGKYIGDDGDPTDEGFAKCKYLLPEK